MQWDDRTLSCMCCFLLPGSCPRGVGWPGTEDDPRLVSPGILGPLGFSPGLFLGWQGWCLTCKSLAFYFIHPERIVVLIRQASPELYPGFLGLCLPSVPQAKPGSSSKMHLPGFGLFICSLTHPFSQQLLSRFLPGASHSTGLGVMPCLQPCLLPQGARS